MSLLFTPGRIGELALRNRLVRSATAEFLANDDGRPRPRLKQLYEELTEGGVGLIITGHAYVHPSGKVHRKMLGVYSDALIPDLAELAAAVHEKGGRIAVQINHGGMECSPKAVSETVAPSAIEADFLRQPAREMTRDEIAQTIQAFAHSARRVQEAGFDAVQLHAAHGYLINQFLSPYVNRRDDEWGGDLDGRMRFLRQVCTAVREQVGPGYPVFVKLGMVDGVEGGLTPKECVQIVAALSPMGLDGVEISGGVEEKSVLPNPKGPYFRHLARMARPVTQLPILLVGGLRSRTMMDEVLATGEADFISVCRPLICEPDLPNRMHAGLQERSHCISCNRCWPRAADDKVSCKRLEKVQSARREAATI